MPHARLLFVTLGLTALTVSAVAAPASAADTASARVVTAQSEPGNQPFVGIWKLDLDRSHLRTPPPDFALYREYQDHGNGWMYHTVINVSRRAVGFLFAAARYDGKQYPVYDATLLGRLSSLGMPTPRTVQFDRISARQFRWTDRTNGRVTGGGLCTVSADGTTLTITDHIPGRSAVLEQVYERQSLASLPDATSLRDAH